MKVILIAGKAMSGKDTAAKMIQKNLTDQGYKILIIHFADLLKYLCQTYFNWDGSKNEIGRTLLQRVGTDVIREQQPDYWVDFIIEFLSLFKEEWDYVIIPDCRFPNELDKWKEEDGWDTISVQVNRLNFKTPLTLKQQAHPSETALNFYNDFDFIINAESGLDKLNKGVNNFLNFLNKI